MNASTRIYCWFFVFLSLAAAAFALPRFAAGNETGFAAGTTAAVTFLGLFAAAGVLGVILLVMTLRGRTTLPAGAKIAGFLPLPLLCVTLFVVVMLALYKQEEQLQNEPPPKTLKPTAVPTSP